MNWLRIGLLTTFTAACLLADVTYDESYGSTVGRYDVEPSPLLAPGVPPTVFDSPFYAPAPFDPANTQNFRVYVKGNRIARVGSLISTIYDLDTGTVTAIDHEKHRYAVLSFAAMERRIEKGRGPRAGGKIETTDTGRTMNIQGETAVEYALTVWNGSGEDSPAIAHAVYWTVQKLPSEELAAFQKRCRDKYGRQYPAICSLTESNGFGILAKDTAGLEGYPVLKIVESRMTVPSPSGENTSPAEIYPADRSSPTNMRTETRPWRSGPPPSFARILRTEIRISNFVDGPVDESKFAIPKGYKQKKSRLGR
jgi:hypothetical protein